MGRGAMWQGFDGCRGRFVGRRGQESSQRDHFCDRWGRGGQRTVVGTIRRSWGPCGKGWLVVEAVLWVGGAVDRVGETIVVPKMVGGDQRAVGWVG